MLRSFFQKYNICDHFFKEVPWILMFFFHKYRIRICFAGSAQEAKLFETLFSITVICSFQVRCLSINTIKYFIEVIRFIFLSLVNSDWSFNGILSFSWALWKRVCWVLPSWKYEKVILLFFVCVQRKGLYHPQTLWVKVF